MKLDPKDLFSPHINGEKKRKGGVFVFSFFGKFLMGKRAWKQLLSLMGPKVWLLSCVYVGKFGSFSSVEISFNAHPSLWQTGNKKRSN